MTDTASCGCEGPAVRWSVRRNCLSSKVRLTVTSCDAHLAGILSDVTIQRRFTATVTRLSMAERFAA